MDNRFKDRHPLETVEIIKHFFESKGFIVSVDKLYQSESGSWTCQVALILNDTWIFSQNGKGVTKEYCLASGHAELFERFCNKIHIYMNPGLVRKFLKFAKEKNGYVFDKDEKILSFNNIDQTWFKLILGENQENVEEYIQLFMQNEYIGVPYINYFSKETHYFDPRFITRLNGSSGMAAGNTLEEALVQGISEIFEHYTAEQFFLEKNVCYYINTASLPEYARTTIEDIQAKTGNEIRIYDLSYNYQLPVCMSLLINKKNLSYHINFGAAPTFEIACERIITELYQGILAYDHAISEPHVPFLSNPNYSIFLKGIGHFGNINTLPEDFILNSKEVFGHNWQWYLNSQEIHSNEEILKEYCKLIQIKNSEFYYRNNSPINNMFAVQIWCPTLQTKKSDYLFFNNTSQELKDNTYDLFKNQYKIIDALYNNNFICEEKIMNDLMNCFIHNKDNVCPHLISILKASDWFTPYSCPELVTDRLLFAWLIENSSLRKVSFLFNQNREIKRLLLLEEYLYLLDQKKYNKQDIVNIFISFGIILTNNDFKYGREKWYQFYCLFKPFVELYHSNTHDLYIKTYID